eukprot:COSAG04_NODE_43_length_31842_cov_15.704848_16_plen_315_part_00
MDGEHAGIWSRGPATPEAQRSAGAQQPTPKSWLNQRPPIPASSSGGAPLSRGAAPSPPDASAEAARQPSFVDAGDDPQMAQRPPPPRTPAAAAPQYAQAQEAPRSPAAAATTGGALNPLAGANQPAAPTPEQMRGWAAAPQYTGLSAPETPMPMMGMAGMQPPQHSNGDTISLKRDSFMMAMVMCALALAVSVYTLWQVDTLTTQQDTMTRLGDSLTADIAAMEATVADKAEASDVTALENTLTLKADRSTVTALNTVVAGKVDSSDFAQRLSLKADTSAMTQMLTMLGGSTSSEGASGGSHTETFSMVLTAIT